MSNPIADLKDEMKEYHRGYLKEKAADKIEEIWRVMDLYEKYTEEMKTTSRVVAAAMIDWRIDQLREVLRDMNRLNPRQEREGDITEEMKLRAKATPWTEVLSFSHGAALCPFHDDHHPSFTVKNGKGRCWSCGWTGDIIDFWMQKNGRTFHESVRALQ